MANMSGALPYEFDAELILRGSTQSAGVLVAPAAVVADTDLAVQELVTNGAYWQGHKDQKNGRMDLIVKIVSGTADALLSCAIDVKSCSDVSKSNPQTQSRIILLGSATVLTAMTYRIPISPAAFIAQDADATHWYATFEVIAGTNPSVIFHAFLAPAACV